MATIPEMQARVSELLTQLRPMQADYDRAIKAWIASEKKTGQAYLDLAERMADDTFGANVESLRVLEQYLTADLEMMRQANNVGTMLKSHAETRDELRALMHRIATRLTYALASDLTDDTPPGGRLDDQPSIVQEVVRTVARSDDPAAKRVVERAMKEQGKS